MSVAAGIRLSSYEIVAQIGTGGMGEVSGASAYIPLNLKAELRDMTCNWGIRQTTIPAAKRTARDGRFRRRAVPGWTNPQ